MTITTDPTERLALPPREGLRRESKFRLRAAEDVGAEDDGLTLDGYAAVFNTITIIDSWEGRFKEQIAPGAMKKSFRESPPRVQFDHGRHPLIGSIPIAAVKSIAEETDPVLAPQGGAHLIARLHDNWLIQPVRDAIASESIDGMSFRFGVVAEKWHDADGKEIKDELELRELLRRSWYEEVPDDELLVRTLKELKVPEAGPVVWPAYTETSVGVRSQTITIDLARLNEPDQRSKLAQAVLMADRADSDDDTPPLTNEAEGHVDESSDTPPITAPAAEKHESVTRTTSNVGRRDILDALRAVRDSLTDAERQKEGSS